MKKLLAFLVLLVPIVVLCVTRTISLDGTQQYTIIQAAIDSSADGDSILVYPGRYIENINLNGHDVSISSLYAINQQQVFIDSTIIDGNLSTCFTIMAGESVTVNGFTILNNEQHTNHRATNNGGGFSIWYDCHVNINNCIIRDCIALYGGGISAGLGSILEFCNTSIYSNQSLYQGGGIRFGGGGQMLFDATHMSNVYNNIAPFGMDFHIGDCPVPINIQIGIGSNVLTDVDNFIIALDGTSVAPNLSINQGYFESINNDVFVSLSGDDNNSGISAELPFKTIKHALQVINSNLDNPRTIHLAAGTYSFSNSGQLWPLNLKPYVRIVGAGADQTILDDEFHCSFFAGINVNSIYLSDIGFEHGRASITNPIDIMDSNNIELRNLTFDDNQCGFTSGIMLIRSDDIILDSIIIGGTTINDDMATIEIHKCGNVYINNILSHDNEITDTDHNNLGLMMVESDILIRNSIIANNTAEDAFVFAYQTIDPEYGDYNLDMSNVLIYNNFITQCSWVFSPVYIQNRFQPVKINNCTFAGNLGAGSLTRIFAYADVTNLISYNPSFSNELQLRNNIWNSQTGQYVEAEVNIRNSLFRTSSIASDLPNLVTLTDNIMNGNPLFLGSATDSLEVTQPEYYYLSEYSPCINTGVADTTGMNLPPMDLAGNQRVWNNRIDMGCYEYGSEPYVPNDNPENPPLPENILLSIYPNPICLNGSKGAFTFIEFTLPKQSKEQPVIEIFNIKGQKVKTIRLTESYSGMVRKAGLTDQVKQNGEFYSTIWNGKQDNNKQVSSGTYLFRVSADGFCATKKICIIK